MTAQQIILTQLITGRKVAVEGRSSMVNVITTAAEFGGLYLRIRLLIEIDQVQELPAEQVLITTEAV